ncbi:MAG: GNAT family N-acetyltransferase [Oscillospiraceae bacterium]|nr:GNAT family N-acetyltransferase [Oscillospiraceae bacterium]
MLKKLTVGDFPKVFAIMAESFPIEEYRPYEGQLALLEREEYALWGATLPCKSSKLQGFTQSKGAGTQQEDLHGFLAVWNLKEFLFLEHFAVRKDCRNSGLGARLLQELQKCYQLPVILEVEPPIDGLSCRRVGFYERNGFFLNPYPYTQPSLGLGREPIPLQLMSSLAPLTEVEFRSARDTLYEKVYGLEP